jgi:hypothetical protein
MNIGTLDRENLQNCYYAHLGRNPQKGAIRFNRHPRNIWRNHAGQSFHHGAGWERAC